jgi:hypothetical protein
MVDYTEERCAALPSRESALVSEVLEGFKRIKTALKEYLRAECYTKISDLTGESHRR